MPQTNAGVEPESACGTQHGRTVVQEHATAPIQPLCLRKALPEYLRLLGRVEIVCAVERIHMPGDAGLGVLERQQCPGGIRHQHQAKSLRPRAFEERLGTGQESDAIPALGLERQDVEIKRPAPEIEAVPVQGAGLRRDAPTDLGMGRIGGQTVHIGVGGGQMLLPEEIVVREIEQRAVHVQQQGVATSEDVMHFNSVAKRRLLTFALDGPEPAMRLAHPWVLDLARRAGDAILEVYNTDFDVESKDDDSPLTRADLAAHHVIQDGIARHDAHTPILSEEGGLPDFDVRREWSRYWLVDPLDGTKEFVKRNGEFTVNIALIVNQRPVFGIVHVPVQEVTYLGSAGDGAWRIRGDETPEPIRVASATPETARVVGSRSHQSDAVAEWLQKIGDHDIVAMGSSLKFCVVAAGEADVYPRLGLTSEWDTGAAQAVVEAAGGAVVTLDGMPLAYNTKADILNPHFMVIGSRGRDWLA